MPAALIAVMVTEMILAAMVWLVFVVHYHWTTHGRWARTPAGRNIMAMAVTITAMTIFTLAGVVLPVELMLWVALLLWPALALVGLHRHRLLWRAQHEDR